MILSCKPCSLHMVQLNCCTYVKSLTTNDWQINKCYTSNFTSSLKTMQLLQSKFLDGITLSLKSCWHITNLRVQTADTFLSLYSTKLSTDWCVHGKKTYLTNYFSKKYVFQIFSCLLLAFFVNCFHSLTSCFSLVYFCPNKNFILRFTQFQDSSYIIYKYNNNGYNN